MKYALISVFDKTGIVDFASSLVRHGYKIISTGGTAKILNQNNIDVIPIQEITGNPESFNGRMKTISFEIESGILFDRSNKSHIKQAKDLKIKPIDIVVCNLYPFEETIAKPKATLGEVIDNIDVGGPTMIRAAAKNFQHVVIVTDPNDYNEISSLLHSNKLYEEKRRKLASKAFAHLSIYDSQIARYLESELFPENYTIPGRKFIDLRYGENPHQQAAAYFEPNTKSPLKNLKRISGRELSLVNLTDINAGLESVMLFNDPCAVVIKHNSPCGIALGKSSIESLKRAIDSDPESSYGGVIVLNKTIDRKASEIIASFKDERGGNIDIISAPIITKEAKKILIKTRKNMGIYSFGKIRTSNFKLRNSHLMNIKWINGGFVLQTQDSNIEESFKNWKIVTKKKPTSKEIIQMEIAWKFISRIRSNAVIVVDKNLPMTRGIGSGQTSRVRSTKIALEQAGKYASGAILASDSFFPFDDSVKLCSKYGISAIVQQGGSINDKLSIEAANIAGISMVFTGRRAFWH